MKNKVKRKPTNREMASAIIEINSKVNHCLEIAKNLDNVIGLYIEMKGDLEYFNKHIDKKLKKENKRLDRHIDAIYNDNNNTAQQIADMFSTMDSQGDEITLIKKVMKEKLNINWRIIEEDHKSYTDRELNPDLLLGRQES